VKTLALNLVPDKILVKTLYNTVPFVNISSNNEQLYFCDYYTVKKYCWFNLKKVSNLVVLKF